MSDSSLKSKYVIISASSNQFRKRISDVINEKILFSLIVHVSLWRHELDRIKNPIPYQKKAITSLFQVS